MKIDGLKNKKTSSIGFFVLFLILCNRITKTQQYGSIIHNRKVQKESVEKTKKIDKNKTKRMVGRLDYIYLDIVDLLGSSGL